MSAPALHPSPSLDSDTFAPSNFSLSLVGELSPLFLLELDLPPFCSGQIDDLTRPLLSREICDAERRDICETKTPLFGKIPDTTVRPRLRVVEKRMRLQ